MASDHHLVNSNLKLKLKQIGQKALQKESVKHLAIEGWKNTLLEHYFVCSLAISTHLWFSCIPVLLCMLKKQHLSPPSIARQWFLFHRVPVKEETFW